MTIQETLAKLNKGKKDEDQFKLLDNISIKKSTTSTGSPYIDYLIGGGFANGGYNQLIASGGVGKSSISLLACKDAMSKGKIAVYFDGEGTLNDSYFERMGINTEKFIHIRGRNLEDMLDQAELFAQSEDVGIIVFDSILIFVATAVEAKSAADHTIGIEAGKFTRRMPIIEGYAARRDICLLGLTSYKLNPNAMNSDPRTVPRGEWQKTMANVTLDLTKKDIIKGEDGGAEGHEIDLRIKKTKNSAYNPKEIYKVSFYNNGGFNVVAEYARLMVELEIVKQGGAWITATSEEDKEFKFNGMSAFIEGMKENEELFNDLKSRI